MSAATAPVKRRLCRATTTLERQVPVLSADANTFVVVLGDTEVRRCIRGDHHGRDEHRTIGLNGEYVTFSAATR